MQEIKNSKLNENELGDAMENLNQSQKFSKTISSGPKSLTDLIDKKKFSNDRMVFISINKFINKVWFS